MWDKAVAAVPAIFRWLAPPPPDAPPEEVYRHNWRIVMYLSGLGAALALHIAVACGALASFGIPGFALAGDVNPAVSTMKNQLARIEGRQIREDILTARREQCAAINDRDAALKASTRRHLEEAQLDYKAITGREYIPPTCDEL
jgi:hypothetical protein